MSTAVAESGVPNGTASNSNTNNASVSLSSNGVESNDKKRGNNNSSNRRKGPRPLRPEEVPLKIQIDEKTRLITKLQNDLAAINRCIYENKGGLTDNDERTLVKSRLDEIQARINNLDIRRNECLDELDMKQRELRRKNKSISEMRSTIGYKNEEEINQQIKMLEGLMMTSSLSLKEEKQMMAQLQQLRNTKQSLERIQKFEALQTNDTVDQMMLGVKNNLDNLREEMNALRRAKREESQKLFQLNESKKKTLDSMREYFDEKSRIINEIKEHISNKQKLVKQLEDLNNEYYAKQKLIYQNKIKKQQEDRERRSLENEIRELQSQLDNCDFLPHDKEIRLLQQIITFINNLEQEYNPANCNSSVSPTNGKTTTAPPEHSIEGIRLIPKKERDEYFIIPKTKKDKNKQKDKSKQFKLDMVTLNYFESCGVEPPTSVEAIPNCKEKLHEKLQYYINIRSECNVDEIKEQLKNKLNDAHKKLEALK